MAYETAAVMQGESLRKGPWHEEEDERLITFVKLLGSRRWDYVARVSGLKRSGKSCRLRWLNYLRPNIKHGHISAEEEKIILQLHERWGNKWSMIARRLPGRTDNEIKNYWRTRLRKKALIQEQENFQFGSDNGEQLFLYPEDGSSGQTYNGERYKPCEDILDTENISYDAVALSDFTLTSSPYQTRLSDWISEFQNDQSEINLRKTVIVRIHATVIQPGFPRRMIYGDVQAPSGTWNKMSLQKCEYEEALRMRNRNILHPFNTLPKNILFLRTDYSNLSFMYKFKDSFYFLLC